jgi:hypothetical protein
MTIPYYLEIVIFDNENVTKQLNSYSIEIVIILQNLLKCIKRAFRIY